MTSLVFSLILLENFSIIAMYRLQVGWNENMLKKRICIGCVIVLLIMIIMMRYLEKIETTDARQEEPDVVSSISMNRDQYLTVVANRDEIENKEELAKLLIQMCKESSFHTIKFSTDRGYATSLHMRVYLWRDKIEGYDPVMTVEFEPAEYGQGYDIVHDSEQFDLFVDGKLCE